LLEKLLKKLQDDSFACFIRNFLLLIVPKKKKKVLNLSSFLFSAIPNVMVVVARAGRIDATVIVNPVAKVVTDAVVIPAQVNLTVDIAVLDAVQKEASFY
jgi:hypothetical protein